MKDRRVLLHCNAGADVGMGHLMRCLGLAQMAVSRGWHASLIGDLDDPAASLLARLCPEVEIVRTSARTLEDDIRAALAAGVDVLHLDSYDDFPSIVDNEVLVSNMQDGPYGVRPADLAIDSNLGAERAFSRPSLSIAHLVGVDFAVVRRQVLSSRDAEKSAGSRPRVLVVMGGTDPHRLTPRVIRSLGRVSFPLDVTVVAVGAGASVAEAAVESRQNVEIVDFVEDLPALARQHDLVISAAGTSVWDFACMGLPMALICVADNQRGGYEAVIGAGLAIGLGLPPHHDLDDRVGDLATFLADSEGLDQQGRLLREALDGRGAWRIVSAWEQLLDTAQEPTERTSKPFAVRPAEIGDARLLFDWRNDESARRQSRTREALEWDTHRSWLQEAITDPHRKLLIVESENEPIATVRWDRRAPIDWEVSVTIAPQHRRKGYGRRVLSEAEAALTFDPPLRMVADIHIDNGASRRLFSAAGYLPQAPPDADGFERRAKWRLPTG